MEDRIDSPGHGADNGPGTGSRSGKENDKRERWFRKKRVIIPLLFLIIALLISFYYYDINIRGYASTDDAFIDSENVTISSKILGRITYLSIDEGDTVNTGDTLIKLDQNDLKAQETQALANIESAKENAKLAQVSKARAHDDFKRAEMQLKGQAITQEQYEHARRSLETADAQLGVSLSAVKSAEAQLNVTQTALMNTIIIAPFRGIVARKWVTPGDVIQPAQPIFTIFDINDIWVTAMFEETKISAIHDGAPVKIAVDAYPESNFEGKVILTGAVAASQFSLIPPNNASGNFTKVTQRIPIKISIARTDKSQSDASHPLRAGMSVEVKVRTAGY
jgi:membrane fusion protein, multidrug efflux system